MKYPANEPQQPDDLEALLDRTLRARSQAGPRAGFHSRLAESLRQARDDEGSRRSWWGWLSAGRSAATLATVVGGTFLAAHHRTVPKLPGATPLAKNMQVPREIANFLAPEPERNAQPQLRSNSPAVARVRTEKAVTAAAETLPKLDTFPSPAVEASKPFGSGDPVAPVSLEAAEAMLSLQQQQARPITLTAVNLNRPLFGERQ